MTEIIETAAGEAAPAKPTFLPPPAPADLAATPAAPAPPVRRTSEPIFLSEAAHGADVLEVGRIVEPLAALCVAAHAQTPFLAAIAGRDGAGKTFALDRLAQTVERLASSADALARVVVARVSADDGAEAPVALASAAYAALDREPGGVDYSALLDESAHAGGDPLRAAKAASDRHDEVVRRLENERTQRDEVEARSVRMPDALLFETPGSRVDVFARARRAAIDARLRRFDLAGTDAGASYRDLVRDMASMGAGGRLSVALRAVWGYPGQRKLILWAIAAFVLGFAIHLLHGSDAISAAGHVQTGAAMVDESTTKAVDWVSSHGTWFETAARILYALGALALILNLWRAVSLASLLLRGSQLLNLDVRDRRRDLDGRLTRLNQRVAALSSEADAAARHADAAARRAGGKTQARGPGPDFLDARHNPAIAARAFLAALGARMSEAHVDGVPHRLVFVVDNLDALAPQAAIAWIEAAQGALGPGSVGILAIDPARYVEALGGRAEARRRFEKWLQVVVNLPGPAGIDGERLVARLLATDGQPTSPTPDPAIGKSLSEPLSSAESALLTALAPLAASSPRVAKRFLNGYRLARCSTAPWPAVALMQALAYSDDETQGAMRRRLLNGGGDLDSLEGPEALVKAVRSARSANGGVLTVADARAADELARRYALLL